MAIVDEPVRGSVPPTWWWSLSGLERIQALARGYIPQPPLCRLLGIRPGHIGPGAGTWTMPATGWLQDPTGELEIALFAEAAMQGIAMSALDPCLMLNRISLDVSFFRPTRPSTGKLVARGRVINASRFFVCTEVQVEDADGRQLLCALSQEEIQRVDPEPPPAPAVLKIVEEANYSTPDPYLRPVTARLPLRETFENDVLGAMRDIRDGRYNVPYQELMGLKLSDAKLGAVSGTLPASGWFSLFSPAVSVGAILSATAFIGTGAAMTFVERGRSFVGLASSARIFASVPADGRPMRIDAGHDKARDNRYTEINVHDADGRLIALLNGTARYVDNARRQRTVAVQTKRMLCTLLFTDIVGSTQHAERLGDKAWHALLDEQRKRIRAEISRCHGTEIDTAGDGFFVRFDSPAEALECAVAAREAVKPLGIEIRAGVHTGECEVTGRSYAGMAVHLGARIMSAAGPSEVLVSSTVKDLVIGSGRDFTDRGEHELKGVPGSWRLYALA